jgi:hypothetical protein
MQIINMSLYSIYYYLVVPFIIKRDPKEAYNKLSKLN